MCFGQVTKTIILEEVTLATPRIFFDSCNFFSTSIEYVLLILGEGQLYPNMPAQNWEFLYVQFLYKTREACLTCKAL